MLEMTRTKRQALTKKQVSDYPGRWVTAKLYSEIYNLPVPTLSNWRFHDKKAGRTEAAPGFPKYFRFGRSVRYWVPSDASVATQV